MKFQTLNLQDANFKNLETVELEQTSFWKRQFQSETTEAQKSFDRIFGIILPTICFAADPIFFRTWSEYNGGILGAYKPFAYLFSYVSILALFAFMLWGTRLKWLNGFLCGLFAVAAFVSLGIGFVALPFSLLGLVVLIGFLGFTPLFTAFVLARNSVRAYRVSAPTIDKKLFFNSAALAAILSLSLPILVNRKIESGIQSIRNGDAQTIRATARRLMFVAPLVDAERLRGADCEGSDKHDALIDVYQELSGKNIEDFDYLLCGDF